MNKHKGKRRVQKRPNYKNVGEEDDEEKGPAEDAQEDAEKAKGTEGGSKGTKTSGDSEGECPRERHPAALCVWSPLCVRSPRPCTSFYGCGPSQAAAGRSAAGPALFGQVTWGEAPTRARLPPPWAHRGAQAAFTRLSTRAAPRGAPGPGPCCRQRVSLFIAALPVPCDLRLGL